MQGSGTPLSSSVDVLRAELRRTREARYFHRLLAVLLVSQGLSCRAAATALGCSSRTLSEWVRRFQTRGTPGLRELAPTGRRPRLASTHLAEIRALVLRARRERGHSPAASGPALARWVADRFGVRLGVRQCQRLLATLAAEQRDMSLTR